MMGKNIRHRIHRIRRIVYDVVYDEHQPFYSCCVPAAANMHKSERCKPLRWIPCAWMPVYNEALAPDRPTQGYEGHPARCARLEHEALAYALAGWDERTAETVDVVWGGTTRLQTRVYLGAVVVDHPQRDKFTGSTCDKTN
jgi:hypothetical protein